MASLGFFFWVSFIGDKLMRAISKLLRLNRVKACTKKAQVVICQTELPVPKMALPMPISTFLVATTWHSQPVPHCT